jgi:tRNA(Leu) C34 or U34 (ribose-2'-O)-methylase TrmL
MTFTKRKFLKLDVPHQHKNCAQFLRLCYEDLLKQKLICLEPYQTWLSWMKLPPFESHDPKLLADRYHWHLEQAGRYLKEHNLLPRMRTGDHEPKAPYLPIAIYLDHVRSAYNVGSILRTCEALRIGAVHCSERTPFIDNEKVERTAMGAAALVPCIPSSTLSKLPRPIIVLDTSEDALPVSSFLFPESFTLVLGNEEYGVSNESLELADVMLEIPLLGAKNSLNVACAFAIAAAEIRKQWPPTTSLFIPTLAQRSR